VAAPLAGDGAGAPERRRRAVLGLNEFTTAPEREALLRRLVAHGTSLVPTLRISDHLGDPVAAAARAAPHLAGIPEAVRRRWLRRRDALPPAALAGRAQEAGCSVRATVPGATGPSRRARSRSKVLER
jgi:hypothetical protein